jgi:predicted DNA-binding transcriptional regulator AlpA
MTPNLLKTDETARLTGLSVSTLNKLRLTGKGPRYIKLGRSVVYDPADISAWVEANRRRSTSDVSEAA